MAQTELHLDGLGIRKIVETPPGIKVLSISGNRLRSLGSIAACVTLEEINLAANKLSEDALAPLAALPALRVLNISRNHVRDLGPLFLAPPALAAQSRAFPCLEVLNISANAALSDVTATMSLQVLRSLTATGLNVTSFNCVHCSLEVVDLRGCCLQSVSMLKALPYLSEFMVDGNALLSCKDLLEHPMLQTLRLAHNAIEEISAVQVPSLTELDLASNNISQVLHLAGAPRLVSLVVRGNQLTSLVPLSPLRSLTFLDASQNQIRALEPSLRWSVRPLRVLLLNGNDIADVEDVAQTMEMAGGLSLEHLDLRNNPLSIAFYPFAEKLPTWTWEASSTLEDFDDGFSSEVPRSLRDGYWHRLSVLSPSLQSLDGMLRDPRRAPETVFIQKPDRPPASLALQGGAEEDEVMYCASRRSLDATSQDYVGPDGLLRRNEMTMSGSDFVRSQGTNTQLPTQPLTVDTADAATSPVFRERAGSQDKPSGMSTEALLNLGLAPELLGEAQRKARRADSEPPVVLAMEVAAAAAAAAVSAASSGRRCSVDQAIPALAEAQGPCHPAEGGVESSGPSWTGPQQSSLQEKPPVDGQVDEGATSSQGSFLPVVDLSACAGRGPLPSQGSLSAWANASPRQGPGMGEPDKDPRNIEVSSGARQEAASRCRQPPPGSAELASSVTSLRQVASQSGTRHVESLVPPEEPTQREHPTEEPAAESGSGIRPMQEVGWDAVASQVPQLLDVLHLEDAFREELMQKGTEFEKQQLQIVEKLEKAHEDLARQWQELDHERKKSTEQQQKQQQLLAREQAELAKYFKDFEAEMEKRYTWQQQQKEEFEEQWQQELAKRRQTWDSEQEKERQKLQQCFHDLEEQFQGKLEAAHMQGQESTRERTAGEVTDKAAPIQDNTPSLDPKTIPPKVKAPALLAEGVGGKSSDLLQPKLDPQVRARLLGLAPRHSSQNSAHARSSAPAVTEPLSQPAEPMASVRGASCPSARVSEEPIASPPVMVESCKPAGCSGKQAPSIACAARTPVMLPTAALPVAEPSTEGLRRLAEPSARPERKVTFEDPPGSCGAFQRALQGQGIWEVEDSEAERVVVQPLPEQPPTVQPLPVQTLPTEPLVGVSPQAHDEEMAESDQPRDLKITASLDATGRQRVVSSTEAPRRNGDSRQAYLRFLRSEMLAQQAYLQEIKSARQASKQLTARPSEKAAQAQPPPRVLGNKCSDSRAEAVVSQAQVLRQGLAEVADFSKRVPAQPASQLRQVKVVETTGASELGSEEGATKTAGTESAWHCMVTPVNAGVRGALEALIAQQAWSVPDKPLAYRYSLGRAIQNITPPARQRFDATISRDAAREGLLPPLGFSQRAFFCDSSSRLSEVISSPFGFGAVYKGRALLFALELRQAERLCHPRLYGAYAGRIILAEIALGRCHTSRCSLQEAVTGQADSKAWPGMGGSVPLANALESEYRAGADSVYFPKLGVVALLCPSRALPVFLAEYSRQLVGQ